MGELYPLWHLDFETRGKKLTQTRNLAQNRLIRMLKYDVPLGEIRLSDLSPSDLGLQCNDWITPPLRKGCISNYIKHRIDKDSVIVISGVAYEDSNPGVTELFFNLFNKDYAGILSIIPTQKLFTALPLFKALAESHVTKPIKMTLIPSMEGLFRDQICYKKGDLIRIDVKSRADKPEGDHVILTGIRADFVGSREA